MAPGIDLSALHIAPTNAPAKQLLMATTSTSTPQILPISLTNPLVLNPSHVTTEFDLLRFHAAAFDQLPKATVIADHDQLSPSSDLLVSSPYNAPQHHLSLSTLPAPSLLFALALTSLAPTTPSYATAPYATALNFPVVIATLRSLIPVNYIWPQTDFYVVVFRSELKPHIDMDLLYTLDFESHREACESGGLLKYWFGKADEGRRNLATCFWHSRADAYKGGLGPWHRKARAAGREMYERIVFSTWRFRIGEGVSGWEIEEWADE